jgi:pantothenate kinase-related protein Tda10
MESASTAYKVLFILDFLRPHLPLPALSQFQGYAPSRKPFLLALSGVQGCGKSTLVEALCVALSDEGYQTISFSIDDFYLTAADLRALRAT